MMQVTVCAQKINMHIIHSALLDRDITYKVALPEKYSTDKDYFYIYLLDGEMLFFFYIINESIVC